MEAVEGEGGEGRGGGVQQVGRSPREGRAAARQVAPRRREEEGQAQERPGIILLAEGRRQRPAPLHAQPRPVRHRGRWQGEEEGGEGGWRRGDSAERVESSGGAGRGGQAQGQFCPAEEGLAAGPGELGAGAVKMEAGGETAG